MKTAFGDRWSPKAVIVSMMKVVGHIYAATQNSTATWLLLLFLGAHKVDCPQVNGLIAILDLKLLG